MTSTIFHCPSWNYEPHPDQLTNILFGWCQATIIENKWCKWPEKLILPETNLVHTWVNKDGKSDNPVITSENRIWHIRTQDNILPQSMATLFGAFRIFNTPDLMNTIVHAKSVRLSHGSFWGRNFIRQSDCAPWGKLGQGPTHRPWRAAKSAWVKGCMWPTMTNALQFCAGGGG